MSWAIAERCALRVAFMAAPAAIPCFNGKAGFLVAAAVVGGAQLAGAVSASLREARIQESLYRRVGATLVGASAMVPLPLPEAEPELALGRAMWAESRLIAHVTPAIFGEGLALIAAVVVIAIAPLRASLVPLVIAVALAAVVSLPMQRLAGRRERAAQGAFVDLHTHLTLFMSERQERIAQGTSNMFLAGLASRGRAHRRETGAATRVRTLVRRVPVALAIVIGGVIGAALHLDAWLAPASALFGIAILQGGGAFATALAERAQLMTHAEPLVALLAVPQTKFEGTRDIESCGSIAASELAFSYDGGRDAVAGLSFVVGPKRPLILRGPNGSGKSTVLRLVAGLELPTGGRLTIDDVDIATLSIETWRAKIAFVSQETSFDPKATIRQAMLTVAPTVSPAAVSRALMEMGFDDPEQWLDRAMGTLSSGQRRRVQLARAFALDRPVLVLDEPEAGLDSASQQRVRDLLLAATPTKLVLIATHSALFDEGIRLTEGAVAGSVPG